MDWCPLEPASSAPDALHWAAERFEVHAVRQGATWRVTRSWSPGEIDLLDAPRVAVRVGTARMVATFERPVVMAAGQRAVRRFAWPMEVGLLVGDEPVETARPGARGTLLGAIDDGEVLDTHLCGELADGASPGPTCAALCVALHHEGTSPAVLRKCLVPQGGLDVVRVGDRHEVGVVRVRVGDAGRVEVDVAPLPAEGGVRLRKGVAPAQRGALSWLLDAARRSTEYQL